MTKCNQLTSLPFRVLKKTLTTLQNDDMSLGEQHASLLQDITLACSTYLEFWTFFGCC